jgi:hypothetical protein
MSGELDKLKLNSSNELADAGSKSLMSKSGIAASEGSVAIAGDATEAIMVTGSQNSLVINHGIDSQELIRALCGFLTDKQTSQDQSPPAEIVPSEPTIKNEPLTILTVDTQFIGLINSHLATIEELQKNGQLSSKQQSQFNTLKGKVSSLKEINQELGAIVSNADQILQEAIIVLKEKLGNLDKAQGESLLDARSHACLNHQIELLEQFQFALLHGKVVARWLDHQLSQNLAQDLGIYALTKYPQIRETISSRRLEVFYFSISQFLETLSHCLTWGRTNALENPITPVVVDDEIYITAFEHLKSLIPSHLPVDGISQLTEYTDYLIINLPTYNHLIIE